MVNSLKLKQLISNTNTTTDQFKEKVEAFSEVMSIYHSRMNSVIRREKI